MPCLLQSVSAGNSHHKFYWSKTETLCQLLMRSQPSRRSAGQRRSGFFLRSRPVKIRPDEPVCRLRRSAEPLRRSTGERTDQGSTSNLVGVVERNFVTVLIPLPSVRAASAHAPHAALRPFTSTASFCQPIWNEDIDCQPERAWPRAVAVHESDAPEPG